MSNFFRVKIALLSDEDGSAQVWLGLDVDGMWCLEGEVRDGGTY
jgi:hypothetical protein